ncbi:MAG: hypothetical protein HYR66_01280 [Sphingobacteriales bacterium]|nr:hypothetical protein [Sphingobacteriales bacterium]MBI3720409.1 hypothetical protein [Sphingobacteriales bacterium]
MSRLITKYGIYFSIALYLVLFFVTLSWYQFSFDVDGTAYMTIARRMYDGDWYKSINGLWSPLNSFIASSYVSQSANPAISFKIINAVSCIGIIAATGILLKRFIQNSLLITGIFIALPVMLLSWTHQQLAGDLLSLLFMLVYINLITSKNFFTKSAYNIYAAVIMALAYLAKSFCLPFFLINHIIIHLWYQRSNQSAVQTKFIASRIFISFSVFFLIAIGWIYCLYLKYNKLTFSTAGTLNYNWFLGNGSATLKDYGLLIPPPYPDSPNFWEDPYSYYTTFYGPLSSFSNFAKAIKLVFHNLKESVSVFAEISFTLIAVYVYWMVRVIKSKQKEKFFSSSILLIASIILVTGYLLIHIETRYIWLAGIIGLILGAKILEEKVFPYLHNKKLSFIIALLFIGSFLLSPADKLQDLKGNGKDIYDAADLLTTKNIHGSFTSNYGNNAQNSWCTKLAFLSHNSFFLLSKNDYSQSALIDAIRQNNIRFYLYCYNNSMEKENFLTTPLAKASKQIITIPGKDILLIQLQ